MSNSLRNIKRRNRPSLKIPRKPIGSARSFDIMSMTLPRTLVINADTDCAYLGEKDRPMKEIPPLFTGIITIEVIKEMEDWFMDHIDELDKVVMVMTPEKTERNPNPKPGFKVFTLEEFQGVIDQRRK